MIDDPENRGQRLVTMPEIQKQMWKDTVDWFGEDVAYNLTIHTLGLVGESGEFADIIKKVMRGSLEMEDPEVQANLREELVDVFHYLMLIAVLLKADLGFEYAIKREKNVARFAQHPTGVDEEGNIVKLLRIPLEDE